MHKSAVTINENTKVPSLTSNSLVPILQLLAYSFLNKHKERDRSLSATCTHAIPLRKCLVLELLRHRAPKTTAQYFGSDLNTPREDTRMGQKIPSYGFI